MRDFRDRHDAGAQLALALEAYADRPDAMVLALPRGGVVIGYEVATRLHLPLDVMVVRKLGVPGYSELAMGAIASGGILILDRSIIESLGVSAAAVEHVLASERIELERRERLFRGVRPPLDVRGKTIIVVDDGIATGATMRAALEGLRPKAAAELVVAVPVASPETYEQFRPLADKLVSLLTPRHLLAVGAWYRDFSQTTDAEVRELLAAATRQPTPPEEVHA